MPSKKVRELLDVYNCDGYEFYDSYENVKAVYHIAGDKFAYCRNTLFVDKGSLLKKIKAENKMIFWIFRSFKESTMRTREKHPEFYDHNNNYWVVWLKNGRYMSEEIFMGKR